jgi:hypothetical protein
MDNDVTWWKKDRNDASRNQNEPASGTETPGDTEASDIVGRTGEEMPDVAHDETGGAAADDGDHDPEDQITS